MSRQEIIENNLNQKMDYHPYANVNDDACGKCLEASFMALRENRRSLVIASGFLTFVTFVERCMYPSYWRIHPSINSPLVTLFLLLGTLGLLLSLILYSDNLHAFFSKHARHTIPGSDEEGPPPYPGRGQPGDDYRDRTYDPVPL